MSNDGFKNQLAKIAGEAKERQEQEESRRKARESEFRTNADAAYATASAFNDRVIKPILIRFSDGAPGAGKFVCEFNKSDSQPEFIHVGNLNGQRLAVSLLYWVAGSARLNCGFDYVIRDDPFAISSFDEFNLDERVRTWLEERLLDKYREHLERNLPSR